LETESTVSISSAVVLLAVLAGVGLLVVALQVDDWGRDLTTNVAETTPDGSEPLLRPLTVSLTADATAELVRAVAAGLPRWRFVSEEVDNGTRRLRFVRTSRLFRFRDDVTVWIDDLGGQRVVRARSASRVGNADLGQNPRNLRALMEALRDRVR
jgi:uncharacterized protein (DUF1499 family)